MYRVNCPPLFFGKIWHKLLLIPNLAPRSETVEIIPSPYSMVQQTL